MAQLGGFKLILQSLKDISQYRRAVKGKRYTDANGSVYIGQHDGRLLLDEFAAFYTKSEIDALIAKAISASSGGSSGGSGGGSGGGSTTTEDSLLKHFLLMGS